MQIIIKYVCLCIIYGIFKVSSFFFRKRLSAWFFWAVYHCECMFLHLRNIQVKNRANALLSLQEGEWVVTGEMCEMCQRQISHPVKHGPKLQNSKQVITECVWNALCFFLCPLPKSLCLLCLFLQVSCWRIGPQSLCTSRRSLDQFSLAEPTSVPLSLFWFLLIFSRSV